MDQIWNTEAAALAGFCRREIAPARLFNDPASDLPTTARCHPSTSHSPRQLPPSRPLHLRRQQLAQRRAPPLAAGRRGRRHRLRRSRRLRRRPCRRRRPFTAAVGAPASHGRASNTSILFLPELAALDKEIRGVPRHTESYNLGAMKPLVPVLLLALACATAGHPPSATPPAVPAGPLHIVIVGTTDLHGWFNGHDEVSPDKTPVHYGGLATFATYVDALRGANPGRVVVVDSGDLFQGTLESNLFEGEAVVDAYNDIGCAAEAVGKHE